MKQWQPKYELETTEERKAYIEECIESGDYDLTPALLDRMGVYMTHPYEKENNIKEQKAINQSQKMKVHKLNETGVKYKTTAAQMTRKEKMKHYPETIPYYQMIDVCDAKGKEILGEDGYKSVFDLRVKNPYIADKLMEIGSKSTAKSIYDGLHADIDDTIQLYKTKEVKINPMNFGGKSGLRLEDIDYTDEYVLRAIFSNYKSFCATANADPDSIYFVLKLDTENMAKSEFLTDTQKSILEKVMYSSEKLTKTEFDVFYRACKNIANSTKF